MRKSPCASAPDRRRQPAAGSVRAQRRRLGPCDRLFVLTCRRALRVLITDGVLVPGTSPNARPRVPARATAGERYCVDAARALSGSLAALRRAAGLTQPQLAEIVGMSITTIGHAETGRLWQSRRFWERADTAVYAGGELLALHDAYRASAVPVGPSPQCHAVPDKKRPEQFPPPAVPSASESLTCVTFTWADGTVTTVYPPSGVTLDWPSSSLLE